MPDYLAAAKRHFSDGDHLSAAGRFVNASQLWAYGAECTLKAILQKLDCLHLGMDGKPERPYRKHINDSGVDLIGAYVSALSGHVADYALPDKASWFDGWRIDERYEDGSVVAPAHVAHKSDKEIFRKLLMRAFQNGYA